EDLPLRHQERLLLFLGGHRHEVGQNQRALAGLEPGLHDVGVLDILPAGSEGGYRRDAPPPGGLVEYGPEDRRAVEPGPAEPVDRAVAADQRGGPTIADQRVVLDSG